ncbi:MAG: hypothetical protein ABIN95_08975, partial [Mucilaginibacter sp.]
RSLNGNVPVFRVESVDQPTWRPKNDRFVKYAETAMLCDPSGGVGGDWEIGQEMYRSGTLQYFGRRYGKEPRLHCGLIC